MDGHEGQALRSLIEVKGEGGYVVAPPSPARCHPSFRVYRYADGSPDLTRITTITPEEREVLFSEARALSRVPETPAWKPEIIRATTGTEQRPGDDFNARATWEEVLEPHGWRVVGCDGEELRWCRPGKGFGVSATTNHGGSGLLHVFSSSAEPLEMDRSYSKFAVYALLSHRGDFAAAARALRQLGYGAQEQVTCVV